MPDHKPYDLVGISDSAFEEAVDNILAALKSDGEEATRFDVESALSMSLFDLVQDVAQDVVRHCFGPNPRLRFRDWLAFYQSKQERIDR